MCEKHKKKSLVYIFKRFFMKIFFYFLEFVSYGKISVLIIHFHVIIYLN